MKPTLILKGGNIMIRKKSYLIATLTSLALISSAMPRYYCNLRRYDYRGNYGNKYQFNSQERKYMRGGFFGRGQGFRMGGRGAGYGRGQGFGGRGRGMGPGIGRGRWQNNNFERPHIGRQLRKEEGWFIDSKYLSKIKSNEIKTVVITASPAFQTLKAGENLRLFDQNNNEVVATVKNVKKYNTVEELLEKEDITTLFPDLSNKEEVLSYLEKTPRCLAQMKNYGVLVVEIK